MRASCGCPRFSRSEPDVVRQRLEGLASRAAAPGEGLAGGETGLSPALSATVALERPLILWRQAREWPRRRWRRWAVAGAAWQARSAGDDGRQPRPLCDRDRSAPRPVVARVRQHPYVRLALNGSFSAMWAGQLISMFGDRLNQLALVAVVLVTTGSALASGLAFFVATLPNLLLSPIAGTLVDRWDHKETMVVSDLLRAALVLLVPVAAEVDIVLVYPLIFTITTVSVFFRPARVAILPRIVPEEDLLSANSAMWVGETIADVVGYPLAAIFVTMLGTLVPLAFWVDAATYLASAALLSTIVYTRGPGREPTHRGLPTSLPSCGPAGSSCAAKPSSSRTRSRARPASSASASRSP